MKKTVFAISMLLLTVAASADPFTEKSAEEEAEVLVRQENQSGESRASLDSVQLAYDLSRETTESFLPEGDLKAPLDDVWVSKHPNDLKPIKGAKWALSFEFGIPIFTVTLEFENEVLYEDDGTVVLPCRDRNGRTGDAIYTDMPYGGRGFRVWIYDTTNDYDYLFFFNVCGDLAVGMHMFGKHSTGDYADFIVYGSKISGPPPESEPDLAYKYYVPYFVSDASHATGIGLSNLDDAKTANTEISLQDNQGLSIGKSKKKIQPRGQEAFVVGDSSDGEGWVLVESDQPLGGLCFLANIGAQCYMADMPISSETRTEQVVPHVAQNKTWDTVIFVCNPNSAAAEVTLEFVDSSGILRHSKKYTIPGMGSGKYALSDLVGAEYANGRVEIVSSQPVAAFALYTDLKSGGMNYAGICAIGL